MTLISSGMKWFHIVNSVDSLSIWSLRVFWLMLGNKILFLFSLSVSVSPSPMPSLSLYPLIPTLLLFFSCVWPLHISPTSVRHKSQVFLSQFRTKAYIPGLRISSQGDTWFTTDPVTKLSGSLFQILVCWLCFWILFFWPRNS